MCHKSARGLAEAGEKASGLFGLANFLAQHYTASGRTADILAGYLKSVDSGATARRSRPAHRRAAKPKKPAEKSEMPDKKTGAAKADAAKSEKPAMSEPKPHKKKPASQSTQAKSEKPKAAEKKTD